MLTIRAALDVRNDARLKSVDPRVIPFHDFRTHAMPNTVAQLLHFGVYLVALAAWTLLEITGHAQGGIDSVLPAIIGTAAGSVIGYNIKAPQAPEK